jgi:hypothetical protein
VKFFLIGIIETCNNSNQLLKDIIALKKRIAKKKRIYTLGKKVKDCQNIVRLFIFKQPIVDAENGGPQKNRNFTSNRLISY